MAGSQARNHAARWSAGAADGTRCERHGALYRRNGMPRRIIDISVALKGVIASDPPYMLPSINYVDHKAGAENFHQVFGVPIDQLPDGAGPAVENVAISTHNGTHLDAPYHFHPTKGYKQTGDARIIWEGHKAGREIGYCHMEKLANLDALPDHGFKVACFPVKIDKASAGWTRAVAIIEG